MSQVVIAPVDFEELETLHALAVDTFVEAFGAVNTPENMSTYLSTGMSINQLESELKSLKSKFYFAFYDQVLAGYLKLNFYDEPVEGNPANSMEIERIYVKGQFQGKKIGDQFMQHALKVMNEKAVQIAWLGVWEYNPRATAFYERYGFVRYGTHDFKMGDETQTDILMRLERDH